MLQSMQAGSDSLENPLHTLRGQIQDKNSSLPLVGLGAGAMGVAAAFWFIWYGVGATNLMGTPVVVVLVLAGVFLVVMLTGWLRSRNQLAIHHDRVVLGLHRSEIKDAGITIRFEDLQRISFEKSYIRMQEKSGRRVTFKAPRLQVADAFDLLAEKVELINPGCSVRDKAS